MSHVPIFHRAIHALAAQDCARAIIKKNQKFSEKIYVQVSQPALSSTIQK
jgi:hypothetical protein